MEDIIKTLVGSALISNDPSFQQQIINLISQIDYMSLVENKDIEDFIDKQLREGVKGQVLNGFLRVFLIRFQ